MIKSALVVRERIAPLVHAAPQMQPAEFEAAYRRFLTEVQAHV